MKVIYKGQDSCLLTDYNGKTYVFRKNVVIDVPYEVYNSALASGHVGAFDLRPYEAPDLTEKPVEPKIEVSAEETPKKRGRPAKS